MSKQTQRQRKQHTGKPITEVQRTGQGKGLRSYQAQRKTMARRRVYFKRDCFKNEQKTQLYKR